MENRKVSYAKKKAGRNENGRKEKIKRGKAGYTRRKQLKKDKRKNKRNRGSGIKGRG